MNEVHIPVDSESQMKCEHNWSIILEIKYAGWDEIMRFRGELKDIPVTIETLSHKVFCPTCKKIMEIQ